jgi:hypothetical protein
VANRRLLHRHLPHPGFNKSQRLAHPRRTRQRPVRRSSEQLQSAAGMDDISTEHLSSPNLSCASDRKRPKDSGTGHAAFTDSPTELNGIRGDPPPTYSSSPHATDTTEKVRHVREIDDVLTNGTSGRSTVLPSLSSSPSPNHWNGESKPMIGQHPLRATTSAGSTGQPRRTSDDAPQDVSPRQDDQPDSDPGASVKNRCLSW